MKKIIPILAYFSILFGQFSDPAEFKFNINNTNQIESYDSDMIKWYFSSCAVGISETTLITVGFMFQSMGQGC